MTKALKASLSNAVPVNSQARQVLIGAMIAFFCVMFHSLSGLYGDLVDLNIPFQEVQPMTLRADLSSLAPGDYYVSLGRPRAICSLTLDGQTLTTNGGGSDERRDSLLMGAAFNLSGTYKPILELQCQPQGGLSASLTSKPMICLRTEGLILQFWRAFTQLVLGPLCAFVLLTFSLTQILARLVFRNPLEQSIRSLLSNRSLTTLAFAVTSLVYSFSLAHATRFWLSGTDFTALHIVLRSLFACGFCALCIAYGSKRSGILILQIFHLFVSAVAVLAFREHQIVFYKFSAVWFTASALFLARSFGDSAQFRTTGLIAQLAMGYAILIPFDFLSTFVWESENLTPSILAILCFGSIYLQSEDQAVLSTATAAQGHIDAVFNNALSIEELLGNLAMLTGKVSRFSRTSAYIDAFLCGASDRPGETFLRVFEQGYKKETKQDRVISFADGQGAKMRRALDSQEIICERGERDGAWFAIVPIGLNAFINISDDRLTRSKEISSRLETLHILKPSLNRLKERIVDFTLKQCIGLERMRAKFGHTKIQRRIGSIFLDVDSFGSLTDQYGSSFSSFVSDEYLPALVKKVASDAVGEYMRGDELYLVIVPDLIPKETSIEEAVSNATLKILSFVDEEGAELCEKMGFPPLTIKVGIAMGEAAINCDSIKVRTSGKTVIAARRLLECASAGQTLLMADQDKVPSLNGFTSSSIFTVLQKQTVLNAVKIRPNRHAATFKSGSNVKSGRFYSEG